MITETHTSKNLLDLGTLYFEKGELSNAVPYLLQAREWSLANKKVRRYFNISYMLLRAYLEMGMTAEVEKIKTDLQQFVIEENVEMSSRLYYTLGICAYLEKKSANVLTFFNQAFNVALSESDKENMCFALCGKAVWFKGTKEYDQAFALIENLKVFFQSINIPEVESATWFCEAQIFHNQGRYKEALESLWKAFNVSKKSKSVQFMNAYILIQFGATHIKMKNFDLAENYFDLAEGLIDPADHARSAAVLADCRKDLEAERTTVPDIKINVVDHIVEEASKGKLELNNQFILLELLVEFVKKKGCPLTKADLAEMLWSQDYDPSQHDNKIYVTIRRLRKLLEPNPKKPHYILRTKDGYQLNPATIVEVHS
ncbi:MAG: winged helix-turn-helix domain-containing protein [Bdellovibrionales bacterium]